MSNLPWFFSLSFSFLSGILLHIHIFQNAWTSLVFFIHIWFFVFLFFFTWSIHSSFHWQSISMNLTIDSEWYFPNLCERQKCVKTFNVEKEWKNPNQNWLRNVFGAPMEFKFLSFSFVMFFIFFFFFRFLFCVYVCVISFGLALPWMAFGWLVLCVVYSCYFYCYLFACMHALSIGKSALIFIPSMIDRRADIQIKFKKVIQNTKCQYYTQKRTKSYTLKSGHFYISILWLWRNLHAAAFSFP